MTILCKGSRGEEVKEVQRKLNLQADGIFGTLTEEAVKVFQREKGLTADGIVGNQTWANLLALPTPNPRKIDKIIIHCTATAEGKDYDVATIRQWHLQRGFNDIGYHYVIYRDGSIHGGRAESKIGAHCTGQNAHSIGVCYVGGLDRNGKEPKDTRTEAQKASLVRLVRGLRTKYPNATIHGHNEFAAKACPCFDVRKEKF